MESNDFAARILRVESMADIPKADRISVARVLGYESVVRRNPDGSHAFEPGERIIYVPEDAIIPDELLQRNGLWGPHHDTGVVQGLLAGPGGRRVRIEIFRKQLSTGLVWKMMPELDHLPDNADVTELLGITKHVDELSEDVLRFARPMPGEPVLYSIPRLKNHPTLLEGDEVVLTEKLEGECLQMTWLGGAVHDEMFHDGRIAVASKGLAMQGLCFRDLPEVRREGVIRAAFNSGFFEKLEALADVLGRDRSILLVSEAIGPGIKKLHYGGKAPFARGLDIAVDGVWMDEDAIDALMKRIDIPRAPVLWRGMFDADVIESFREGKTTFDDKHIREGVVIKATGSQQLRETVLGTEVRPVLKVHSDVFQRKLGHDK